MVMVVDRQFGFVDIVVVELEEFEKYIGFVVIQMSPEAGILQERID